LCAERLPVWYISTLDIEFKTETQE